MDEGAGDSLKAEILFHFFDGLPEFVSPDLDFLDISLLDFFSLLLIYPTCLFFLNMCLLIWCGDTAEIVWSLTAL
jgi:hypothetical protein